MLDHIRAACDRNCIQWRQHALVRMLERDISRQDVFTAIANGKVIESYPELKPYPGCLMCGKAGSGMLHVVLSLDNEKHSVSVITVYIPDKEHFEENGENRKGRM